MARRRRNSRQASKVSQPTTTSGETMTDDEQDLGTEQNEGDQNESPTEETQEQYSEPEAQEAPEEEEVDEEPQDDEEPPEVEEDKEDPDFTKLKEAVDKLVLASSTNNIVDISSAKTAVAAMLVKMINGDFDTFKTGWEFFIKTVREERDNAFSDDKFMAGMLPPHWVIGPELSAKLTMLMTIGRGVVDSKRSLRKYVEFVDFGKLKDRPANFGEKVVENFIRYYNL